MHSFVDFCLNCLYKLRGIVLYVVLELEMYCITGFVQQHNVFSSVVSVIQHHVLLCSQFWKNCLAIIMPFNNRYTHSLGTCG